MTSSFKIANAMACEHLVQGQGNKHTLINTYSGDILVAEFPARLPIAFYIELVPNIFGNISLSVQLSYGRKLAVEAKAVSVFEEGNVAVVAIPDGLMLFEKPGVLKVSIRADGEKSVLALKKEIRLAGLGVF